MGKHRKQEEIPYPNADEARDLLKKPLSESIAEAEAFRKQREEDSIRNIMEDWNRE